MSASRVEEPAESSLLYLLKQVELAVRAGLDEVAALAGLSMPKFIAMTVLTRHPGMTSAQLARYSFVRPQTMAAVVTSLESLGYVSRQRDPTDRRNHCLTLTPAGSRLVDELSVSVRKVEDTMLAGFTDSERLALRDFLVRGRRGFAERPTGGRRVAP